MVMPMVSQSVQQHDQGDWCQSAPCTTRFAFPFKLGAAAHPGSVSDAMALLVPVWEFTYILNVTRSANS